jgi:ABC-type multidrug transport system ATPase subunit
MNAKTVLSKASLQVNNQGTIKEFDLTQPVHRLGRDRAKVDLFVPENWSIISREQAIIRQNGDGFIIIDGDGEKPSTNRLYINQKLIDWQGGYVLNDGDVIHVGLDPKTLIEITYINPSISKPTNAKPLIKSINLKNKSIVLGRDSTANFPLDAPTISRNHATIDTDGTGRYILRDHSTNGVFVNNQRVNRAIILNDGATIKIGPYSLVLRGDELHLIDRGDRIRLDVHKLVLETKNTRRLDDLSFPLEPGQFIALVGGSGAGKSTLMRTLLGTEKATTGNVYLNGEDLQRNFNIYRDQIGYVPQDDIIHLDLTVEQVLTYAAKLRLPPDINIKEVVEKSLESIQMTTRRHAHIKALSGGQRKRVSIGVELLADPKLFFLDEPTSGLDPGLDKEMMELLKQLAHEGGRTIVLVTHATANITACDRIVFLGAGGKLCYFGTPQEALTFFQVTDFADIYIQLKDNDEIIKYRDKYKESTYYQKYIENRLSNPSDHTTQLVPKEKQVSLVKQWSILSQRYFTLLFGDRLNITLSLLTAPIGISLISPALKYAPFVKGEDINLELPGSALKVLFVFTCAALWVGFSTSLQEIVKENAIYLRERLVNLKILAYVGSKFAVLSLLAILQSILVLIMIAIAFKSPDPDIISWPIGIFINTFLTLISSLSLGLLVSALVGNSTQANSALPLLLLPQIIFSGALFKVEGIAKQISWLMISRWSIGGYGAIVDINGLIPKDSNDQPLPTSPFQIDDVYDATMGNLQLNWLVLLLHITIYLGLTLLVQKRKDII